MLGLQKKVCILKEKKLENIPIDLANRIYVEYTKKDLEKKLQEWLVSKKIISKIE